MEDSATLSFSPEFDDARPLLHAEVAIIIQEMKVQRGEGNLPTAHLDMVEKHAEKFSYITPQASVVESLRTATNTSAFEGLHEFEVVQIANLGIMEVDEAKRLIPSLRLKIEDVNNPMDDAHLEGVLQACAAQREQGLAGGVAMTE